MARHQIVLLAFVTALVSSSLHRPLAAQGISTVGLAGMRLADPALDHEDSTVSFSLACDSQIPFTAWVIRIDREYQDGSTKPSEILEDHFIQLANQSNLEQADSESGVCYTGQTRKYSLPVAPDKEGSPLTRVQVQVAAIVDSDGNFWGDGRHAARIRQLRSTKRQKSAEWLGELQRIKSSADPVSEMIRTANQLERRWPTASPNTMLFDKAEEARDRGNAHTLRMIASQIDSRRLNARAAFNLYVEAMTAKYDFVNEHVELREIAP